MSDEQMSAFINNKLKASDANNLRKIGFPIKDAIAMVEGYGKVSYKQVEKNVHLVGAPPAYQTVHNTEAETGRFYSESEDQTNKRVIVLGPEIRDKLFGKVDPIGKSVKVNGQSYEVVGITKAKGGGFGGQSQDAVGYIPLNTYFSLFDAKQIQNLSVLVSDQDHMGEAIKLVEQEMLKRLDEEDFSVVDSKQILSTINQVLSTLTIGLGGIAAISLVVGGIGIMNIMLVSVTERTREIGLRKAIGATPNVIMLQFLIESVILSVLGGLVGILIAFVLTLIINNFFPAHITSTAILLAFSVSSITGVVFGAGPARRAASLSPIEALRYE